MVDGPDDREHTTLATPTKVADEAPSTINERRGAEPRPQQRAVTTLGADRYELLETLGRGGMGEVLVARDEQLGREVAVKRMLQAAPSVAAIERFLREARVQGRLDHPAIVPVHELGRDVAGLPFFVMKKVSGTTLADIIKADDSSRFPRQRLLRAFVDVCLAVEFAHVRGVVHRDLKPANIVLGEYGETYILDWGIAKVTGDDTVGAFADVDSGSGENATVAGTVIGTPGYIAPEQVRGATDIDPRADVYSLGCTLFEILAGERLHPRGLDALHSTVAGIDARPSIRAPRREIPLELDTVCVDATRPHDARIASARALGAVRIKIVVA